ncbi:MAG: universal stress protein [Acidobacteria bacterium]|nr:universal stress protein [Acidobacteriota bacterium]
MDWKTILAPIDFSEPSRHGVHVARDLARQTGARLVVLHVVVDVLPALLPDVAGFRYDEIVSALAQRTAASLPEFFPESEREGLDVSFRVEFGVPHNEIIRAAEELPADVIVIATHGRSGAMHLLIGSVTEKVVRRAPCPVLVAPRPR